MIDAVSKRLPLGVATVLAVALAGPPALAQSEDGIRPAAIQNINVQKVDGKSAIGSTGDKSKRAGKLMAFSSQGYLPDNIIKKAMDADKLDGLDGTAYATLAALMSSTGAVNEADNPVHWNQIMGVPPNVLAGDTTRSFIAETTPPIATNGFGALSIIHPVSLDVEWLLIPARDTGLVGIRNTTAVDVDGQWFNRLGTNLQQFVFFKNLGIETEVKLRVTVWNDNYLSPSAARKLIKVTFIKNPKKALQGLNR
jgi:hypothetical protein